MVLTYEVLRINTEQSTVTVILHVDANSLQEDVDVDDFTDLQACKDAILLKLAKFYSDVQNLEAATGVDTTAINPLVNDVVTVAVDQLPALDPADDQPLPPDNTASDPNQNSGS